MIPGRDHAVVAGAGETVVRRRLDPDAAGMDAAQEAALLAIVARVSPVPVPRVLSVAEDGATMVMQRMPGRPLLAAAGSLHPRAAAHLGDQLGGLLAALHAVPRAAVETLVPVETASVAEHHAEALRMLDDLHADLPARLTGPVADLLAAPPPEEARMLRLCHNDLGAEHVFVAEPGRDPATVTGVIDWSDAAIGDPCVDLGLIWRDLGRAGLDAALARLDLPEDEHEEVVARALFLARVRALEDFEFGLATGRLGYLSNASRALGQLF